MFQASTKVTEQWSNSRKEKEFTLKLYFRQGFAPYWGHAARNATTAWITHGLETSQFPAKLATGAVDTRTLSSRSCAGGWHLQSQQEEKRGVRSVGRKKTLHLPDLTAVKCQLLICQTLWFNSTRYFRHSHLIYRPCMWASAWAS